MALALETPPRGLRLPARPLWSSRRAFVLAAAGAAIGLGDVWAFPPAAGRRGGGDLLLIYLATVALVGLPLLMAELALGRRGGRNPVGTLRRLARAESASPRWEALGWLGVANALVVLSVVGVVAGWAIAYLGGAISGTLLAPGDPTRVPQRFAGLLASPFTMVTCQTLFLLVGAWIVRGGLQRGLERATRFLLPALLALLGALVLHAMLTSGRAPEVLAWLARPDVAALRLEEVTAAVGHAVFTLGAGLGGMVVYGSHLSRVESIPRTAGRVAALDLAVVLGTGLAVMPLLLARGLDPAAGVGLAFVSVPVAMDGLPAGGVLAAAFFAFLGLAALTTAIALLETVVSLVTERFQWCRPRATVLAAALAWGLGVVPVLSFNAWAGVTVLGRGLFDAVLFVATGVLVPLAGLGLAVFAGWVLCPDSAREELGLPAPLFHAWRFLVRWAVPAVLLAMLAWGGIHLA